MIKNRFHVSLTVSLFLLATFSIAQAQYSGGSGTADDPYRIATAADLIRLGERPRDYDRHFVLTADIDLDPNLPGGRVFDRAVIAPDVNDVEEWFQGTSFAGVFDGNGRTISHLLISGTSHLGLFGHLGSSAQIQDLNLVDVSVSGSGEWVGSLAGRNGGRIIRCYSNGCVTGNGEVGGLVGRNGGSISTSTSYNDVSGVESIGGLVGLNSANVIACNGTGRVTGDRYVGGLAGSNIDSIRESHSAGHVYGISDVGGLVGLNDFQRGVGYGSVSTLGTIFSSCSASSVIGETGVGGLVGSNNGAVRTSYSASQVEGVSAVGGLAGALTGRRNGMGWVFGSISTSYSSSRVTGIEDTGGLVGKTDEDRQYYSIEASFWDLEISGQTASAGGTGLTTSEMQDPATFTAVGWDFFGQSDVLHDIWFEPALGGYPVLYWQVSPEFGLPDFAGGRGELDDPYLISTGDQLNSIGANPRLMMSHFALIAELDLTDCRFNGIGAPDFPYRGVFDGNGHTISHLTIQGDDYLGLFRVLGSGAQVRDLGVIDVNIVGSGGSVGGLVGRNEQAAVTNCYSTGVVKGSSAVGGLVGYNDGVITSSHVACTVVGDGSVGGLVGSNMGKITVSYSTGTVSGKGSVGGYVESGVGGLVGTNGISVGFDIMNDGVVINCYSVSSVSGDHNVGGLVGINALGYAHHCFWDMETSGQATSDGGLGKSTAEMQTAETFMDWGACGHANTWTIDEGRDYPRLWWENAPGEPIRLGATLTEFLTGTGTPDDPYLIHTADELNLIRQFPCDYGKHFKLMADIDLSGYAYDKAVIAPVTWWWSIVTPPFTGVFDGNGHTISHLTVTLFGELANNALVHNLSLLEANISDNGILAGTNSGSITRCFSSGVVTGHNSVGGLAGTNYGSIITSNSTATVSGDQYVGGLVGTNYGHIRSSFSDSSVSGNRHVGGLVGVNHSFSGGAGTVRDCYSTGKVAGNERVGGLVGSNWDGTISTSYSVGAVTGNEYAGGLIGSTDYSDEGNIIASLWDIETSGQATSLGGTGLSTAEMQTASTFLNAGWDFIDETENGTADVWWILEGQDYPRLWWELEDEEPGQ